MLFYDIIDVLYIYTVRIVVEPPRALFPFRTDMTPYAIPPPLPTACNIYTNIYTNTYTNTCLGSVCGLCEGPPPDRRAGVGYTRYAGGTRGGIWIFRFYGLLLINVLGGNNMWCLSVLRATSLRGYITGVCDLLPWQKRSLLGAWRGPCRGLCAGVVL